ncbi:MAG TPA: DMT family transporter, partial [Longimicrobiales bacterium]|nr:DMT family transporter [Longimicrobiales bacterium]
MTERESAGERGSRWGIPVGLRYMAGAAFFFSVMSLLVKIAGQRLPTQEVVLARSAVGALLSWSVLRARGVSVLGNRRGLLLVRAVLGYGALSCFFYALVHLPLADATVIQYTNPVFTALLAAVLLSERLRLREVGLVLVSLAGVVLMARPVFLFGGISERLDMVAAAIALLGAVLSAGAYVTVRKLGATEDPLVIVFYFAALSTIGSLPLTAMDAVMPTAAEWVVLGGIGVLTQFGQVLMTKGLRAEAAGRAMAVGYMQIVFAAIWGALFFA